MNTQKTRTRKTVFAFASASFLHDVGSDMIFSIWPLFLLQVSGANMAVIGLIDGLGDAIVSVSQAVSGYLSDRLRKRKIFVWIGYLLGSVARIGYALSPTWQWLLPFRILDRSGKMRGAPRDAMLSEVSTRKNRGYNFGILRAMDNAGAVVGIVLTMLLIGHLGYRTIFLLAAVPSVLAVIIILTLVRESGTLDMHVYKGMQLHDISGDLRLYILLSALFSIGNFSYSFLLLFAQQAGFQLVTIPALYLLFTLIAALFSFSFGTLSDRMGRKAVLLFSFLFWAGVSLCFLASHSTIAIISAFVLYGLHKAALDPVQRAFVAELAPKEHTAGILGSFQMVIGLCSLPASLLAGLLWETFGAGVPFAVSVVLTLLASFLLLFVREERVELQ